MILLLALTGCASLDSLIHNPVHCSRVGEATCAGKEGWDAICLTCEEPLVWDREYDWIPGTLEEGEQVRGVDVDAVTATRLATADGLGELDTYLIPAHADGGPLAGLTILYNHGNYASLEHYMPRVRFLHELGAQVFAWDYRGYGKSEPDTVPTPEQFLSDAGEVWDLAASLTGGAPMAAYGYSLGAIPAVEQALQRDACVLLLEAPFTSLRASADANVGLQLPGSFLGEGSYENVEKVADLEVPLLAFVGDADTTFPAEYVAELVDNAGGPAELWVLPGVLHGISGGGVPEAGLREYGERMADFVQAWAPGCVTP
ncbi:MAG: alpha/beta fold hydrolase [Alphaproteobacteria bacterium]|nr:alpha/beta fold hydrolase [Alphaproteobacteria bacterium]